MKRVVNSEQVLHLWANQAQSDARNSAGNVFFNGDTAYSYGHHFPLGTIYKRGRNSFVLLNSDRHSVTTSKHQSWAAGAVRHLPSVCVPDVMAGKNTPNAALRAHKQNLAYLQKQIAEHTAKALRAMQASTVNWRQNAATQLAEDAERYVNFFDKRLKAPHGNMPDFARALERARAIESPDPVRDAKRFKALQARIAASERRVMEKRDAWRAGTVGEIAYYKMTRAERQQWRTLPCMLRVNGDEIQTSQGARIPVSHASRLWGVIQRVRESGVEYKANGHSEHAGQFKVDRIETNGDLHAGCHHIQYAELELMARRLGLA